MKKFAVIGNPVNHSLSPAIHQEFAKQFNITLEYTKIHADKGEFEAKLNEFIKLGGFGLNVTLPYKTDAYLISDQLSERAKLAKAVNTLTFKKDCIAGDNTDGAGLVYDLVINHEFKLTNKRILIIGAGGAVRGVLGPLLDGQPKQVSIANRTAQKAVDLADSFSQHGPISGSGLDDVEQIDFDLVINATAASLGNQIPQVSVNVLKGAEFAYDMMYSSKATVFMQWAKENGVAHTADGLGMLVEQAAAAFGIWHGERPDSSFVLAYL